MVLDRAQPQSSPESFQPSPVESTSSFNPIELLKSSNDTLAKSNDLVPSSTKAEPETLDCTNPFARSSQNDNRKTDGESDKLKATDPGSDLLVADDKPLRKSELPDFKKFTPEEQAKTAADLAKEITEKGFTKAPELRDKIRAAMLRVYMDGDKDGSGNQKAMEKFVEQISEKLPKGMSLKIDSSETNKELAAFKEKAQAAIDKQPGMMMGTSGQLQLLKTEDGKTTIKDKFHFAASIRKPPTVDV